MAGSLWSDGSFGSHGGSALTPSAESRHCMHSGAVLELLGELPRPGRWPEDGPNTTHTTMAAAVHASAHAARITSGREACCSRSAATAACSSRAAWAPQHRPRRAASTSVTAPAAHAQLSSSGGARPSRQQRRLAAPPRAAAEAEAPAGALVPDRQGYRSFLMVCGAGRAVGRPCGDCPGSSGLLRFACIPSFQLTCTPRHNGSSLCASRAFAA